MNDVRLQKLWNKKFYDDRCYIKPRQVGVKTGYSLKEMKVFNLKWIVTWWIKTIKEARIDELDIGLSSTNPTFGSGSVSNYTNAWNVTNAHSEHKCCST